MLRAISELLLTSEGGVPSALFLVCLEGGCGSGLLWTMRRREQGLAEQRDGRILGL